MKWFKDPPSIITSGTRPQREVLASLIERGRAYIGEEGIWEEHPDLGPFRITQCKGYVMGGCPGHRYATPVGCAVLGLAGEAEHLVSLYLKQKEVEEVINSPDTNAGYEAAAEMLGLPSQLLWDTDFQACMGMLIEGVIDELRRE